MQLLLSSAATGFRNPLLETLQVMATKTTALGHLKAPCTRERIFWMWRKKVWILGARSCTDSLSHTLIAAKLHPERTYYYRKFMDMDSVIDQCNKKVSAARGAARR